MGNIPREKNHYKMDSHSKTLFRFFLPVSQTPTTFDYQVGYAFQVDKVIHLQIIQSSGSCNNDIYTFCQVLYLSISISTTIYTNTLKKIEVNVQVTNIPSQLKIPTNRSILGIM